MLATLGDVKFFTCHCILPAFYQRDEPMTFNIKAWASSLELRKDLQYVLSSGDPTSVMGTGHYIHVFIYIYTHTHAYIYI